MALIKDAFYAVAILVGVLFTLALAAGLLALASALWFITIPVAVLLMLPGIDKWSRKGVRKVGRGVQVVRHAAYNTSPARQQERMEPMVYQRPDLGGRTDLAIVDCPSCDEGFNVITNKGDVHQACPVCYGADVDEHSRTPRRNV